MSHFDDTEAMQCKPALYSMLTIDERAAPAAPAVPNYTTPVGRYWMDLRDPPDSRSTFTSSDGSSGASESCNDRTPPPKDVVVCRQSMTFDSALTPSEASTLELATKGTTITSGNASSILFYNEPEWTKRTLPTSTQSVYGDPHSFDVDSQSTSSSTTGSISRTRAFC
jgi:hypothetical protein